MGLRPKKSFGQHFLASPAVARAIAAACVPDAEVGRARVVEIGAGTGALTRLLGGRARTLVAIERDRDLVPRLVRELSSRTVRILEADAKTADYSSLLGERDPESARVLCGNLPYAITGPLLRTAVEHADRVERVVFLVQKEVADRLSATPGTKCWGALSVFVRAAYDVQCLLRVPPGAFHPPPRVTSALVALIPLHPPRAKETETFRRLVRGAFASRRKTLRNAWAGVAADPATLERAAARAGIALEARGETLDVPAFAGMARELDASAAAAAVAPTACRSGV